MLPRNSLQPCIEQDQIWQVMLIPMERNSPDREVNRARRRISRLAFCVLLALFAVATGSLVESPLQGMSRTVSLPKDLPQGLHTLRLQNQRIVSQVGIVGTIQPGRTVNVLSPFDAPISEKLFEYGQHVTKNQKLAKLDTFDLQIHIGEAEEIFLKALKSERDLKNWNSGEEVARAQRNVTTVQLEARSLQQKLQDTKKLLDRGIIARQEYQDLLQRAQTEDMSLAAAKQDLNAVIERGGPDSRKIADIELENAKQKLDFLKDQLAKALILAPVSGVVMRPPETANVGAATPVLDVGIRVTRGQLLIEIADIDNLAVTARVDEMDVNQVQQGQPVEITAGALGSSPVSGRVTRVASQASPSLDGGRNASFEIWVSLHPLSTEQARQIRVGMSASLKITTYENPDGIIVPPNAIHRASSGSSFITRLSIGGQTEEVQVRTGDSTESGIEILEGIHSGDIIVLK
jgi:multidrug efflux pump subunit AcrA (membrane-fusion protein)